MNDTALNLTVDVRTRGRWLLLPFMLVWLAGWAAGEGFALWAAVCAVGSLVGVAAPPPVGWEHGAGVGFTLVFFVFWLTVWSIGGLAAMAEVVRLLTTTQRLYIEAGQLTRETTTAGVKWSRAWAIDELSELRATGKAKVAMAVGGRQRVLLTARHPDSAREVAAQLRGALGLPDELVARVPAGMVAVELPGRHAILQPSVLARRRGAAMAVAVGLGAVFVATRSIHALPRLAGCLAIAAIAFSVAARLAFATTRWLVQPGLMVKEQRWRTQLRAVERFEPPTLKVSSTSDSDGDEWWALDISRPDGTSTRLWHRMNGEDEVLELARYLARRVEVTLARA